jgi:hypothetical protein
MRFSQPRGNSACDQGNAVVNAETGSIQVVCARTLFPSPRSISVYFIRYPVEQTGLKKALQVIQGTIPGKKDAIIRILPLKNCCRFD